MQVVLSLDLTTLPDQMHQLLNEDFYGDGVNVASRLESIADAVSSSLIAELVISILKLNPGFLSLLSIGCCSCSHNALYRMPESIE